MLKWFPAHGGTYVFMIYAEGTVMLGLLVPFPHADCPNNFTQPLQLHRNSLLLETLDIGLCTFYQRCECEARLLTSHDYSHSSERVSTSIECRSVEPSLTDENAYVEFRA